MQIVILVDDFRTGFTVISIVVGIAHWPVLAGVKVYVVVPALSVLIFAGLHVPEIPLLDVFGNCDAVEPWHKGPIWAKVGSSPVTTNTSIVVFVPH